MTGYSAHTPGPYLEYRTGLYAATPQDVDHGHYRGFNNIEPGAPGYLIAESIPHGPTRRVLSLAPEMLALLQELIDIEGPQPGTRGWAEKVRAVIAKATGAA